MLAWIATTRYLVGLRVRGCSDRWGMENLWSCSREGSTCLLSCRGSLLEDERWLWVPLGCLLSFWSLWETGILVQCMLNACSDEEPRMHREGKKKLFCLRCSASWNRELLVAMEANCFSSHQATCKRAVPQHQILHGGLVIPCQHKTFFWAVESPFLVSDSGRRQFPFSISDSRHCNDTDSLSSVLDTGALPLYLVQYIYCFCNLLKCSSITIPHCLASCCFSFNLQTEKGSALHEAALFGKTDVVQILLAAGERMIPFWSNNAVIPSPSTWGTPSLATALLSNQLSKWCSSEGVAGEVIPWCLPLGLPLQSRF